LLYIILIEIGENKHLDNNHWAGNNSSIISSLLKKIPELPRTFQAWIFFNKFKDFPGFSRTVGTLPMGLFSDRLRQVLHYVT
jgi:hypothetical protein